MSLTSIGSPIQRAFRNPGCMIRKSRSRTTLSIPDSLLATYICFAPYTDLRHGSITATRPELLFNSACGRNNKFCLPNLLVTQKTNDGGKSGCDSQEIQCLLPAVHLELVSLWQKPF